MGDQRDARLTVARNLLRGATVAGIAALWALGGWDAAREAIGYCAAIYTAFYLGGAIILLVADFRSWNDDKPAAGEEKER